MYKYCLNLFYVSILPNSVSLKIYSSKALKCFLFVFFFPWFQYTTEDLLDQIQASEEEIMAQLQVLNACVIEGSVTYHNYSMELIM